jgi:peptidoglycan LD-endopeptidase CwlK
MSSRSLDDLDPIVATKCRVHIAACAAEDIDILITCTYRTAAEQDALYAQGRTAPGHIITNAKGGQSMHQYRVAYDLVLMQNGKPVWDTSGDNGKLWERIGELGEAQGLEWAGRWTSFKEMPHFQFRGGHPLSYFQAGGKL